MLTCPDNFMPSTVWVLHDFFKNIIKTLHKIIFMIILLYRMIHRIIIIYKYGHFHSFYVQAKWCKTMAVWFCVKAFDTLGGEKLEI